MFNINEMDVIQVKTLLAERGEAIRLIDVRTPAEVAAGAIPGAVHIPLHTIPAAMDRIPEAGEVVIYCRTGVRSAQACAFLSANGRGNVHNLRGGIMAWVQQGQAVA